MTHKPQPLVSSQLIRKAVLDALIKLNPRSLVRNPVMLLVAIGTVITFADVIVRTSQHGLPLFESQVFLWLLFTVLFANFAEAIAEGRGKAQADELKRTRTMMKARRVTSGREELVSASDLALGDVVVCEAGDLIPADGDVIEGIASVDESAITGESAPVIRESGGDRSAVTGGTRVLSDRILVRISVEQGQGFLDRMISLVEGARRLRTPNEIALGILLVALSLIFLLAVASIPAFVSYATDGASNISISTLVSLFVCLIPTTISGLLSAIGISGMDRLLRRNVLAMSGKAVEAAGDIDVMLLDKTGTITIGNRQATDFLAVGGFGERDVAIAAQLCSMADATPEGRSIVVLAKEKYGLRERDAHELAASFIPFTAETRMSGVDMRLDRGTVRSIRKGASDSVIQWVRNSGGIVPAEVPGIVESIARSGGTPLVVAEATGVIGVVALRDIVKGGIRDRFARLRSMGIRTVMITGDNPLTAASIAAEAGVDDFIAEARPEDKLARIRAEQSQGRLVAMIGDGTNDAPALAQADVGVAMNTGTQAAREAGNMIDLDSNPTKLIEIVEIGKQLLMTRGALTTFSIANDVAKYFAILPAIFATIYTVGSTTGPLAALNIMGLKSPESAVLSAVIFNAVIIIALIPLALRGVGYKPQGASIVLRRNLLVYGLGGIIVPFVGIKLIDLLITALGLA